jgi:hypothetical protein
VKNQSVCAPVLADFRFRFRRPLLLRDIYDFFTHINGCRKIKTSLQSYHHRHISLIKAVKILAALIPHQLADEVKRRVGGLLTQGNTKLNHLRKIYHCIEIR